jgi:hypothetical protein
MFDDFDYNHPGTTDAITGVYYFFPYRYYTDPPVGIGMDYSYYDYLEYGWYYENLYYNRFEEGVTLIAGDVSDFDGVNSDLSYQWLIGIPFIFNGMPGGYTIREIEGATTSTYAVPVTGAGLYFVYIRYIDGRNQESIAIAEQVVTAISNGNGTAGAITSSTAGVFQEGVTLSAGAISGDPDGNGTPTAYQWFNGSTAIDGATSSTYIVAAHGTGTYKVAITYTDGQGFSATVDSAEQVVTAISNGNGTPGAITGNGVLREGVTLTAPVVTGDPDGMPTNPNYKYQWFRNNSAISGATGKTYKAPTTGSGNYKVGITYTDAQEYTAIVNSRNQFIAKVLTGTAKADTLRGTVGDDLITGLSGKDTLTGLGGEDTFKYALNHSLLSGYDRITDFAIGTDKIDGPKGVSAVNLKELGRVSALNQKSIATVLTNKVFTRNGAAAFTYGSGTAVRTFLALNDKKAGFSSATDAVIEITGFTGNLTDLTVI